MFADAPKAALMACCLKREHLIYFSGYCNHMTEAKVTDQPNRHNGTFNNDSCTPSPKSGGINHPSYSHCFSRLPLSLLTPPSHKAQCSGTMVTDETRMLTCSCFCFSCASKRLRGLSQYSLPGRSVCGCI